MPASWNAGEYRNRATAWRLKAESLPAGRERDACQVLADGYLELGQAARSAARFAARRRSCRATRSFDRGFPRAPGWALGAGAAPLSPAKLKGGRPSPPKYRD